MPALFLRFTDENGEERRTEMDRDAFTVGRHSACDLTYTDGLLSREHLRIERDADGFRVSDLGSSNGTTLNGSRVSSASPLKDEDVLDLGGGLRITIEIEAGPETASPAATPGQPDTSGAELPAEGSSVSLAAVSTGGVPTYAPAAAPASGGIPTTFFFIAPLLGILVLGVVVGGIALFGGGGKTVATNDGGVYDSKDDDDYPVVNDRDDDSTPAPVKSATPIGGSTPFNSGTVPTPPGGTDQPPGDPGEKAKVERNGTAFVRQIAIKDPRAFLTGEQALKVGVKVKEIGRSAALADNINSARKNAAAIKSLAVSKGLKPQFLAVAGIVKLGGGRGDVLQAVQSVVEVYDKLRGPIGAEFFDDALLLIAAYDQGVAGETMKLRNAIEKIADDKKTTGNREIRTIWYLEKAGVITKAEYDRALTFLAVGTIAQNPREFGVNAEALGL